VSAATDGSEALGSQPSADATGICRVLLAKRLRERGFFCPDDEAVEGQREESRSEQKPKGGEQKAEGEQGGDRAT